MRHWQMKRGGLSEATVSALDAAVCGMCDAEPASRWTLAAVLARLSTHAGGT